MNYEYIKSVNVSEKIREYEERIKNNISSKRNKNQTTRPTTRLSATDEINVPIQINASSSPINERSTKLVTFDALSEKTEKSVINNLIDKKSDLEGYQWFKKRSEAANFSYDFEVLVIARTAFELAMDTEVADFSISSNEKKYLSLDDIVFEVILNSGAQQTYAMQLKYTNSDKFLQETNFGRNKKNGDFNLFKYFKDYETLIKTQNPFKFILCTNSSFAKTSNELKVKFEDDEIKLRVIEYMPKMQTLLLGNQNKETCHYCKFQIIEINGSRNIKNQRYASYLNFFEHFLLFTSVMNVIELKNDLHQSFRQNLSLDSNVCKIYLEFIKKWFNKIKKIKLNKTFIKRILTLYLISAHIETIRHEDDLAEYQEESVELFAKIFSEFKITVLDKEYVKKIQVLLDQFTLDKLADMASIQKQIAPYDIIHPSVSIAEDLNEEEFTKIVWLLGKCPIIVSNNADVKRAIELSEGENLRFILLKERSEIQQPLPNSNTFVNLLDLEKKDSNICESIFKKISFMLQGQKILLNKARSLFEGIALSESITASELLSMVDNSLHVDELEQLPPAYIQRSVSQPLIDIEFLKNLNRSDVILISECGKGLLKGYDNISLMSVYLKATKARFNERTICVTDSKNSQVEFDHLCSLQEKKNFHHFRLNKNQKLEWLKSKCSDINTLKKFQINDYYISESDLLKYEADNPINIICDDSGMGKTSLTRNMKNHVWSETLWTILIPARDHFLHLQENSEYDVEEFQKYILQMESERLANLDKEHKSENSFAQNILNTFMETKRVRYIWDGLDESSTENFKVAENLISELSKQGYRQWLTSRNINKNTLETRYNVFSRALKKFDRNDQKAYILKRLKQRTNLKKILGKQEFLETPMHIFIFTKLLMEDPTKLLLLEQPFTIADLYKYYVDIQIDTHFKIKMNFNFHKNQVAYTKFTQEKEKLINNYEEVAAMTICEDFALNGLNGGVQKFLQEIREAGQDVYGIILKVTDDNKAEFSLTSIREYFATSYFVKNISTISKVKSYILENENISILFDAIASYECRAHKLVLSNNLKGLKTISQGCFKEVDKAGRNVLHLACCYFTKHPFLQKEEHADVCIIDDRSLYWQEIKTSEEHEEILTYLLEHCDSNQVDYFGYDCLSYAYKKNNFPLDALLKDKLYTNSEFLKSHIPTVLYYSIRFDYDTVFDKIENIPLIKSKFFNKSLLFLAVFYNSFKCLQKLLPHNHRYREIAIQGQELLLAEAYRNCNNAMMAFLLNNNADLKAERKYIDKNNRISPEKNFSSLH